MLKKMNNIDMGKSDLGWLQSSFHFSFAEYWNPYNMGFGKLRVLNDDLVKPGTGFDTHPHQNMEIISYIVSGEITHGDSMGNKRSLTRGNVQYMSAGTGVLHSEHNYGDEMLRLLQIWIYPDKAGYTPNYGDYEFDWSLRENKWLNIVSGKSGNAPIKINQDVNVYVLALDKDKEIEFEVKQGRQAYLVQIEGKAKINSVELDAKDALEIVEEDIKIVAEEKSHFIVIEMKKE
ncbi:pirin family protein [uncultured Clostridium sp.]|uniref:pirin family protein n=1 Tax=uncultured Clostridium sp. TaxID=59620 RepID=UPI002634CFBE|nr:pirin family protein [uncultured Clostridium sp.]